MSVLDADRRASLNPHRHADRPLGVRWLHDPAEYGARFGALALDNYCDTTVTVPAVLERSQPMQDYAYGMLNNATYGCCDPAAMYHLDETVQLRRGHDPKPWAASTVLAAYFAMNGVPPGPAGGSSDQGTDPAVGMNWWLNDGLSHDHAHRLLGWGFAPNTSPNLRRLIYEFGGGVWAVQLGIEQQSQGVDWVWVPGETPGSWGGHAIDGDSYDENGFGIVSWGEIGTQDNAFVLNAAVGLYVPLTQDALTKADAGPGGVQLAQMRADLAKYTQGENGP